MAEEVVLPTETPWEQLTDQGENALWCGRFLTYRDMGPNFFDRTRLLFVRLAREALREKMQWKWSV